ncbi:hypothetical protein BH23BAC2_BH23BAC2_16610 [soil metagenome]
MRLLFTLGAMLFIYLCQGQNKQLLYNFNGLPQTLMVNPGANITFDGHIGVPLLSGISLAVGSSGVTVYDVFEDSPEDINQRITAVMRRLTHKDYFTAHQQLEIISLGWKLNANNYISTGIYQELDIFSYFPKDPAILAREGNFNYIGVPFDFSHVSFTGEFLTVYHVGMNRKMNRQLTLGARVKFYSGIFNVESVENQGTFLTISTPGGPNFYRHFANNLDVRVNTSGFTTLRDNNTTVQEASRDLLGKAFFGGNIGIGGDIGFTYQLRNKLEVSGSVVDLGVMWQRNDVENYTYKGTYQTDGIEPLFPETLPNGSTFSYWDEWEDEIDRNLVDETLNESYTTWRPFKFNAGVEFGFGETFMPCDYRVDNKKGHHSRLGVHLFGIQRPQDLKMALTTYYDREINKNLRMKVTYTVDDYSYTNVGLLVSTRLKSFNFYIAADNLLGYINLAKSHYQSVHMGFQFLINKK